MSENLFENPADASCPEKCPLAARMRPTSLDEIVGQDHILGRGKLLRRAIEADRLSSVILFGPAGCGKTSVAEVIARTTKRQFRRASGVLSNVSALRSIMETAKRTASNRGTILFIDEIHRFNKAQQDVLLPYVEDGSITLIGATTHNPQFFINTPLTSRSLVFELRAIDKDCIMTLLGRALSDPVNGYGESSVRADPEALRHIAEMCEGDARKALTSLEIAVLSTPRDKDGVCRITAEIAQECVQKRIITYDHDEEGHYNTISAFIKSIRGSDPDAAVYWLAKMLEAGEDPRFIARRLVISASEDIGNADPRGLSVAVAAMQAVEFVGMPEASLNLSQATIYLASAPKSNASCTAINAASEDVRKGRLREVPEHLRNIHVKAVDKKNAPEYKYPHEYAGNFVKQDYMPGKQTYYRPTRNGYEDTISKRLEWWKTHGSETNASNENR